MKAINRNGRFEILSVEDSKADQFLIEEMLKSSTKVFNLSFVRDGVEALSFIRREGEFAYAPRPDLILLDLNLPKKSGHEVLSEIRAMEGFEDLPILVLTVSESQEDALKSRQLKASGYLPKPSDLDRYNVALTFIERFFESLWQKRPELSVDSLKKELKTQRLSRRTEREDLKARISRLESCFDGED